MCWCTPSIRTHFCGKPHCHPPLEQPNREGASEQLKADAKVHPVTNELRPDWQRRVIDEKAQNDERLEKLSAFLDGPVFQTLSRMEQIRLKDQHFIMRTLSKILGDRINSDFK